jgi:hypothetical protein
MVTGSTSQENKQRWPNKALKAYATAQLTIGYASYEVQRGRDIVRRTHIVVPTTLMKHHPILISTVASRLHLHNKKGW